MYTNYKSTKFLSEKTKKDHLKLLDGYTKNTETLQKKLPKADTEDVNAANSTYRTIVDSLRFNYNAQLLHSMYFSQISSEPTSVPVNFKKWIADSVKNTGSTEFKTFDDWKEAFIATSKASRGWVVFGYDPFSNQLKNVAIDSHDVGLPPAFLPILVLDVWEHAYVGDFGTDRAKYVKEWFRYIDWQQVEKMVDVWEHMSHGEDLLKKLTGSLYNQLHVLGHLEG